MDLGEAGGADREVEALAHQPDQLDRVAEPARVGRPLGLAARRVAAQGEHVLDARGLDAPRGSRRAAPRPRRRRERWAIASMPRSLLDPLRDLDGAVARGAAGAVGHGDEVGRVVLQDLERALERPLALVGLRREELEREDGTAVAEDAVDAHGRRRLEP